MSNEQLVDLIKRGIQPKENMEQLYLNNEKYIYSIIKEYSRTAEIDDLMQEAYIGLKKAVDKYDCNRNTKFTTYAIYWIRQTVARYVENTKSVIRISSNFQHRIHKYNKCKSSILSEYNREPTLQEYATFIGIKSSDVRDMERIMYCMNVESLDTIVCSTVESNDYMTEEIDVQLLNEDLWEIIKIVLNNNKNYDLLEKRYKENLTQKGYGEVVGVSPEYIHMKEAAVLEKLKNNDKIKELAQEYGVI